jgi:DNA-binding NarL/FixJ family response regulator
MGDEAVGIGELPDRARALRRPKTILIADDNESVRAVIRRSLECETSFKICGEATDGVEAVSKAKELTPDLIVLDMRMPRLNGMEVAATLREAMPRVRVVLISMYGDDLAKTSTSAIHLDAVIPKSDGITTLIESVKNLLAD